MLSISWTWMMKTRNEHNFITLFTLQGFTKMTIERIIKTKKEFEDQKWDNNEYNFNVETGIWGSKVGQQ